jgi:hypothetical protein
MNPPGMAGSPVGDGGSAYFALESERTRLTNALLQENLENRSTVRELNALLDRPVQTPLETVLVPPLHPRMKRRTNWFNGPFSWGRPVFGRFRNSGPLRRG